MTERMQAIVGARISEFKRKMAEVQAIAMGLPSRIAITVDVNKNLLDKARKEISNDDVIVIDDAPEKDVKIDAKIGEFRKKIAEVKALLASIPNKVSIKVDIDKSALKRFSKLNLNLGKARKEVEKVEKKAQSLPRKIFIEVEARVEKAQKRLDRIAQTIQSFSTVAGNMAMGSLMAISPAAIPIIASAGAGIMALGSAFAVAGAGAIAFGAVAIPTIKKLFDENAKLTAQQQKARDAFDKFKSTYQGIVKELEKPVLDAFTKAMNIATKVLDMARPLFDSAAKAVNNLLDSLNTSLDSPPVKAFFDYMNKQGGPMLETLGKAFGNVFKGLLSLFTAFGPLAEQTSGGFLKMTQSFAEWAAGLGKSEKFQKFISYVQTNGPKVLAFVGQLVMFLINLGIAMAPMGAKILEIVTGFLSWVNTLMSASPIFGQIIGFVIIFIGLFQAIVPAIIMASTIFSGFGGLLVKLFPKLGTVFGLFKSNLIMGLKLMGQGMLTFAKNVAKMAVKFLAQIAKMLARAVIWAVRLAAQWLIAMGPIGWIIAAVVALVIIVIANWDKIKKWTVKIWKAVVDYIKEKAKAIWNWIKDTFNDIVDFLKGLGGTFLKAGKGLIEQMAKGIKNAAGKVINQVKDIAAKVRDFLPFSPAKTGPLSDIDKLNFGGPIADSIGRARGTVRSALTDLLQVPDMAVSPSISGGGSVPIRYDTKDKDITAALTSALESMVLDNTIEIDGEAVVKATGKPMMRYMGQESKKASRRSGGR